MRQTQGHETSERQCENGGGSRSRPYLVGLTGNIACGKSAVLAELARLGAEVIDADQIVHELQQPGEPVLAAIAETFGQGVLAEGGALDRQALGALVFSDPSALARLEGLVHPAVRTRIVARVAASTAPVVVIDAIKLFEGGLAELCDETWVVTCTPEQQLARLMARNGFDATEARRRIAAQPPAADKVARAAVTIDNSGTLAATHARVAAAWNALPVNATRALERA